MIVGKGRVDNSESSFLDLLYLVIKVHREVVATLHMRTQG
jgi:hypothetical protein